MKEWLQTAEGLVRRRMRGEKPPAHSWDPELVRALLPVTLPFYYWYWRVDVDGIPNIPKEGPALLAVAAWVGKARLIDNSTVTP